MIAEAEIGAKSVAGTPEQTVAVRGPVPCLRLFGSAGIESAQEVAVAPQGGRDGDVMQ